MEIKAKKIFTSIKDKCKCGSTLEDGICINPICRNSPYFVQENFTSSNTLTEKVIGELYTLKNKK